MRNHRVPYLESRPASYYFRFRFPPSVTKLLGRTNIRLSLQTRERAIARERIARVLPHVLSLRRLCRNRARMSAEQFERAVKFAVKRVIDTLEGWQEPWAEDRDRLPEYLEMRLFKEAFGEWPDLASTLRLDTDIRRSADETEGEFARRLLASSRGGELARIVLTTLGIEAAEDSKLFC